MLGGWRRMVFLLLAAMGSQGCAGGREVRYVYQDGTSGVIGMPENSSRWPTYYRKHAEELMSQHFPEGYEIVRAEEVVEGSRTLTVKGSNAAEIDASGASQLLSLGKLGRTSTRSQSDSVKIKECRILYKKAEPGLAHRSGEYAAQASWSPAPYVDPNAPERRLAKTKPGDAGKPDDANEPVVAKAQSPDQPEERDEPVLETIRRTAPGASRRPAAADSF
jgi:hypothetical protein